MIGLDSELVWITVNQGKPEMKNGMPGIGFVICFFLLTARAQAEERGAGTSPLSSLLYAALPVLAIVMLLFWFQRGVQAKLQAKRREESARKHEREREKLARSLDRILQARSMEPEGGVSSGESDPGQPENRDPNDRRK